MNKYSFFRLFSLMFFTLAGSTLLPAQHSIAREWSEAVLKTVDEDLARPAVQARNLFHFSVAMYDAWAAYDTLVRPYMLGQTTASGFTCPCKGVPAPKDLEAARKEAISFAAYRFLTSRFTHSPQASGVMTRFRDVMTKHGYDYRNHSIDYTSGSPAALGNYIAQCVLQMGSKDGSNEENNYSNTKYQPANPPIEVIRPGAGQVQDPNRWQPVKMRRALDNDGYPMLECRCGGKPLWMLIDSVDASGRRLTGTQSCQTPHWGRVTPFALKRTDQKVFVRDRQDFRLYFDPGADFLPRLDTAKGAGSSADYQWNYALVAAWSGLLSPADGVMWDVSPGAMGNVQRYPSKLAELRDFYGLDTGRDPGTGYSLNPRTGQPYAPLQVPRGDFTRVVAHYWSEGPNQETAAGHWLTLLHYVSDQPGLNKKINGKGQALNDLEWDVKACFVLSGALHDAAIAAWGVKGWYDSARPLTALRYMAAKGQCTNPKEPSYHPAGIPLVPGHIEVIKKGDPLAGAKNVNLGKIKFFAWKGPSMIADSTTDMAGTGWILAENWYPYQPKWFISPPYSGFVSGHSALAHAGAEALSWLTGDAYFPGGLGEYTVKANSMFLKHEKGPSVDVTLQWATYRDAADQASLSRLWSGTEAPFDDIPGRIIGAEVGRGAVQFARTYLFKDRDGDGVLSDEDKNDADAGIK
jgi:hypothetical protein